MTITDVKPEGIADAIAYVVAHVTKLEAVLLNPRDLKHYQNEQKAIKDAIPPLQPSDTENTIALTTPWVRPSAEETPLVADKTLPRGTIKAKYKE